MECVRASTGSLTQQTVSNWGAYVKNSTVASRVAWFSVRLALCRASARERAWARDQLKGMSTPKPPQGYLQEEGFRGVSVSMSTWGMYAAGAHA